MPSNPVNAGDVILQMVLHYWWLVPLVLVALGIKAYSLTRPRRRPRKSVGQSRPGRDEGRRYVERSPRLLTEDDDMGALKGAEGEAIVSRVLDRHAVLHTDDVYLSIGRGSTQVDHVALLGDTVLVVETKNYAGMILSDPGRDMWVKYLAGGTNKHPFQNPLRQNARHIRAVERYFPDAPIEGIVVFVGSSTFPNGMPDGVVDTAGFERMVADRKNLRPTDALIDAYAVFEGKLANQDRAAMILAHQASIDAGKAIRRKRYPVDGIMPR